MLLIDSLYSLEVVKSAQLLSEKLTNNLLWNEHINDTIKKASKRLFFLIQLKGAKVSSKDLVLFYIMCIRSVLTYAIPVFLDGLPKYLKIGLERVQERDFSMDDSSYRLSFDLGKKNEFKSIRL